MFVTEKPLATPSPIKRSSISAPAKVISIMSPEFAEADNAIVTSLISTNSIDRVATSVNVIRKLHYLHYPILDWDHPNYRLSMV